MEHSRIPTLADEGRESVDRWFEQMFESNLLIHPDDDPADIVRTADGSRTFTDQECAELRATVARILRSHDGAVYEIGLPYFHRALQIEIDG